MQNKGSNKDNNRNELRTEKQQRKLRKPKASCLTRSI